MTEINSQITKLQNSEQSYKGKVKTHNYINRQNQSTTENCENRRQTKHEKSKQKIVFFTILDILTEFKIPYQAICQTEGTHFQSFGQITGNFRHLAK
jgi:hypothetical protein